ncbi:DnaJ domain-containing protein [Patescibacteria group bacterium]|nr:DnaJ domain-containing protein [Patescibacteria group bacterium]
MNNLYKILGIEKTASPEEVKKAYFVMAKKYHPDSADESEVKKFYEVSEAYQVLSDVEERRAYDLTLEGGKIGKILVEEEPVHPTIFKEEVSPDDEYRKKEMHKFRRAIYWKGVFRAIGFALFLMGVGYLFSLIFGGLWYGGMIAGFVTGLIWSINSNFDLNSFVKSSGRLKFVKVLGWILFIASVGYFVWILVSKFL